MSDKSGTTTFTAQEALQFHSQGKPGKLEVAATKPMATQRDLSLAYSPGVAVPVQAIADDAALAYDYTNKGNLVAVVSNGTAILGMGNLGAVQAEALPCHGRPYSLDLTLPPLATVMLTPDDQAATGG